MRPGRIILMVGSVIVLILAGIRLPKGALSDLGARRASGACTNNAPTDVTCDGAGDNTSFNQTYSNFINAGAGNDSIISYGVIGDSSVDFNDGFFGGIGSDTLINYGTILAGDGMSDGTGLLGDNYPDQLINSGSIRALENGIEGGDGDTLSNLGTIYSTVAGLECLSQVGGGCYLSNTGSINAVTGVLGHAGDDLFENYGTVNSGVTMGTGNDSVYVLNGSIGGTINMGIGNDLVVNISTAQHVDLGDGSDSLYNDDGDTITGYVQAGSGNDTISNLGSMAGAVSLGSGADSLVNFGLGTASSLHARIGGAVFGDAGNDSIINSLNGFIDGIDGGIGSDSIRNYSIVAGVLEGGADNDNVTNNAGALANYIGGGDGSDSLSNGGAINSSIRGGIGSDTVTNFAGGVASWLNGDDDGDRVLNGGFVNADLNGGAGADSVVNLAGAFVAQVYGDGGQDTVVNAGFLNGTAWGGDDNDQVTNLGGAQATNITGDYGNDSVFNGGYLVGLLYGGEGDDSLVNAAFSYSAGADLGGGNDRFLNGGYLNGSVTCGAGSDIVSVANGSFMAGSVACGDGSDTVYLLGGTAVGLIDGGAGSDALTFQYSFTGSVTQINQITAAFAAASPAGGTITIGPRTFTWVNFEALYNLMQLSAIAEPGAVITITIPRRANAGDAAAPVAVYCAEAGVEVWTVGADGESNAVGSFAFSAAYSDLNAGMNLSAAGVTFTAAGDGSFSVSATAHDGKPYAFTGRC